MERWLLLGSNSLKMETVVVNRVIEKLNPIGIIISETPDMKIVNLVVSLNFQTHINLDTAAITLSHSIYEPEVFPGLIYRVQEPIPCAFLIFSSGKVILAGLKSEEDVIPAIKQLGKTLKNNGLPRISTKKPFPKILKAFYVLLLIF